MSQNSPEVLEPPVAPGSEAETTALKNSFNTAMQGQSAGIDPRATDEPVQEQAKTEDKPVESKKDEPEVPESFIGKPKPKEPEQQVEEIPQNAGTKQLREVVARRDAKLKEVQTQLDELKKRADLPPAGMTKDEQEAFKAATDKAAKLEQEFERVAYERSPKFQKYGTELSAEITTAKTYLEGTDISPSVLEIAASQVGQARLKTLREAGMDAETIAAVQPHLARADAIRRERDASLDNWRSEMTEQQKQHESMKRAQEEQRAAEEEKVFRSVGEQKKKELEAFQKVDGHDKWNAMVDQNLKDAEEFFSGKKSLEELAALGYEGVAARTTRLMNTELKRQLNAANEELSRLRAAQPGTGHSTTTAATQQGKAVDETTQYKNDFNNALAAQRG